jgi:hypothetical protein
MALASIIHLRVPAEVAVDHTLVEKPPRAICRAIDAWWHQLLKLVPKI